MVYKKSDMVYGQFYETRGGMVNRWSKEDESNYTDDLKYVLFHMRQEEEDIVKVYPVVTPVWEDNETLEYVIEHISRRTDRVYHFVNDNNVEFKSVVIKSNGYAYIVDTNGKAIKCKRG